MIGKGHEVEDRMGSFHHDKFMEKCCAHGKGEEDCCHRASQDHVDQAHDRAENLPTDSKARKEYPVASGVMDYFPDAIVEVSRVSFLGNQQHNPGQPLHWSRKKSNDHPDTMQRHFLERGKLDIDGQRHSAKMVWRALAILQLEIEAEREAQND